MKILIIHDRRDVLDQIHALCIELCGDALAIDLADNFTSASKSLRDNHYDLCIMDLTLPHDRGRGEPTYEVASHLLYDMHNSPEITTPGEIIGITCEYQAFQRIAGESGCQLMAVVEERPDGLWKLSLRDRITYSLRSYRSRLLSSKKHFDFDVCIVTALDKEFKPYTSLFELSPESQSSQSSVFTFKDHRGETRRGAIFSIGRAGISRAAIRTQEICSTYRPKLVIMSGFCGGVKDQILLGDIAIFESALDWDCGKWRSGENGIPRFSVKPEPISVRDSPIHHVARSVVLTGIRGIDEFVATAKDMATGPDTISGKLHLTSAASGSSVVADEEVLSRILDLNGAITAVDMESYGVYAAVQSNSARRTNVLCIKAVSDYCDGNKHDGLHAACSYLSAACVKSLLMNHIAFESLTN